MIHDILFEKIPKLENIHPFVLNGKINKKYL